MNGFYINLDKRTDRNEHFLKNIKGKYSFFKNVKRMSAVHDTRYGLGCILSHMKCIENLMTKADDYYIILEDDFCILNHENFVDFTKEFENIKERKDWDVITLTPRGKTNFKNKVNNFNQIIDCQTATGYIIKKHMLPILLDIFKSGASGLEKGYTGGGVNPYCADQCWKSLQINYTWLYFNKIFGGQLPGYSDNEKMNVDYNARFVAQKDM